MTAEEIRIANSTYRARGAIGPNALIPKLVHERLKKSTRRLTVLDYGAGKEALHARALIREFSYHDISAYDFGKNFDPVYMDKLALSYEYDLVYASNVLNTCSSLNMLLKTVDEIYNVTKKEGIFLFNYPANPRKGDFDSKEVKAAVFGRFQRIKVLGKNCYETTRTR
jgi:SAM-dependent methyltransferase